jgi:hypothetical protein
LIVDGYLYFDDALIVSTVILILISLHFSLSLSTLIFDNMELSLEEKFNLEVDPTAVEAALNKIKNIANGRKGEIETLKKCFSLIDLTTLNATDGYEKGKQFADNVSKFSTDFPGMPNVAAICVYPTLVPVVKENLTAENVKIASVAALFLHRKRLSTLNSRMRNDN